MDEQQKVQRSLADQAYELTPRAKPSRWPWVLALLVVLGIGAGVTYWLFSGGETTPPTPQVAQGGQPEAGPGQSGQQPAAAAKPGVVPQVPPSKNGDTVDLSKLSAAKKSAEPGTAASTDKPQPGPQAREQAQRKKTFGLNKSLDAVVRSDEKIKVAGKTVKVMDLERKLVVEGRGEVYERPVGDHKKKVTAWGVYLVRPQENLWDIHFRLLKEYMASRGVKLARDADQPLPSGQSSGVGKVLKFAEHMVGVYNLRTEHMSKDLNKLEPGSKLVVFNLSEIFGELDKINPEDLSGIMYDGRVLLLPRAGGEGRAVKVPQK